MPIGAQTGPPDACFSAVLQLSEVSRHPHMRARSAFVIKDGLKQYAPVPRFSRTPGAIQDGKAVKQLIQSWRQAPAMHAWQAERHVVAIHWAPSFAMKFNMNHRSFEVFDEYQWLAPRGPQLWTRSTESAASS